MHSPDYLEENSMIAEDVLSQQILFHKVLSIFTNLLRLKHKYFTLNRKHDGTCVICKIIQYWMRKKTLCLVYLTEFQYGTSIWSSCLMQLWNYIMCHA